MSRVDAGAIDLEPAVQRQILDKERALDRDHFAVLGLPPGATPEEVREAYHALSRTFHPDRYFRKNLGAFAEKLDRIFKRISEANAVLTDPEKREVYLRKHPQLRAPSKVELPPERLAERKSRLARHPYLLKAGKARELLQQAEKLISAGQTGAATEALEDAIKLDPGLAEASRLLERTRGTNSGGAQARRERGLAERYESDGRIADAIGAWKQVVAAEPSAAAFRKLAELSVKAGAPAEEVKGYASRALGLSPGDVEARMILAEALLETGAKKEAKRELQRVLERAPGHERAQALLKRTRWLF